MNRMFSGLRVLDITNNLAGPGAAAMLAEHGAEVIHIEKPVLGDDCRFFSPIIAPLTSHSHCNINRSKKSVVLDLKDPEAIAILIRMIKDTDVLIESSRPGVMKRLGLDYKAVKSIKPDIVYCSVSAFGQTGPYSQKAGYDIIAQAYSSIIYRTGSPDGPPTKIGIAIGDTVGELNAFGSIMAALYYREKTGIGQHIDISLARGLTWMAASFDYRVTGRHFTRQGPYDANLCPYGIFKGPNGGSIVVGAVNTSTWQKLCNAMGKGELANDPRYWSNAVRVEHADEVIRILEDWLADQPSVDEASALLDRYGVPNCKIYRAEDLEHDPHALTCRWLGEIPTPNSVTDIDKVFFPTGIASFSETEIQIDRAPDLGEHNHEILSRYGLSDKEIDRLEEKWSKAHS